MNLFFVLQSTIDSRSADIVQYFITVGLVALVALGWKMALDLNTIKTVLLNPDNGIVKEVRTLRNVVHDHSSLLTAQATTINKLEENAGMEKTPLYPKRRSDTDT